MARQPNPPEVRTVKALRDAKAITAAEQDAALAALSATEPCTDCGGSGEDPVHPEGMTPLQCQKCQGTGEQFVIR